MTPAELEALPEVNWHKSSTIDDGLLVASGWNHSCVLRQNAEVWCWGSNLKGQTGQSTFIGSVMAPSKVMKSDGKPLYGKFIYGSRNSTYVITPEGQLWSFGSNESGKLGVGLVALDDSSCH